MNDDKSKWPLRRIIGYLDDIYPDVGIDCPFFVVEIVVFSAAILQKTKVRDLAFTGCTRNFVAAIAKNMQNNALWVDGKYDCSTWLMDGIIVHDDRFCEETMGRRR